MAFNASPQYAGSYLGVRAPHPPDIIEASFVPGPANWQNVVIGDIWIFEPSSTSSAGRIVYMLVSLIGNQALWIEISSSAGTLVSLSGNIGINPVTPTGGNINVFGDGSTINVSGDGLSTLTISAITTGTGLISTISGNDGIHESPAGGNFSIVTNNTTTKFLGSAATETLNFGLSNLVLGDNAAAITSGVSNVGLGSGILHALTSGSFNTALGFESLSLVTTGADNTCVGWEAGNTIISGSANTCLGANTVPFINSGSTNIAIGFNAGVSYLGAESGNIVIGNNGSFGESNAIRIGTAQTTAFMAGIAGVAVSSLNFVTINTITGQLGSQVSGGGIGTVTTVNGGNNITATNPGGPIVTLNVTGTTNFALQTGSAAGALTSLPLGTLNQVLTSQGAGANPIWATSSAGSGGLTLIGTQTATSSSSLTFLSIPSTFNTFEIIFTNFLISTSPGYTVMQLSTNNGVSFLTTGYGNNPSVISNAMQFFPVNSTIPTNMAQATIWNLTSGVGNITSLCTYLNSDATDIGGPPANSQIQVGANTTGGLVVNALKFFINNGATFSGTISLYGYSQ